MNAAQSEAQLDNDQANDVISSLQKELHAFSSHIEQSLPSVCDIFFSAHPYIHSTAGYRPMTSHNTKK